MTDKSAFYIENILEEMDQPGEWYFEQDKLLLYLIPNTTAGQVCDFIIISRSLQQKECKLYPWLVQFNRQLRK